MIPFPNFNRNYPPYIPHNVYNNFNENIKKTKEEQESNSCSSNNYIDLFGIKLAQDDLIILGLLFFLYNEKVDDSFLFIVLIMLLLN